jgi:type IV pilus assembly protein PilE
MHSGTACTRRARCESGFTLVELMIAVVVVAILAAVAFPTFMDSIRKNRRSDAYSAINAIQQAQERFRANNTTYATSITNAPAAVPPGLALSADSSNGYYAMTLEGVGANSYTVVATAKAGTTQVKDGDCARLRVVANGGNLTYEAAAIAGAFSANGRCWGR